MVSSRSETLISRASGRPTPGGYFSVLNAGAALPCPSETVRTGRPARLAGVLVAVFAADPRGVAEDVPEDREFLVREGMVVRDLEARDAVVLNEGPVAALAVDVDEADG